MKDTQEKLEGGGTFDPFPLHSRTSKLSTSTVCSQQYTPRLTFTLVTQEHLGLAFSVSEPDPENDHHSPVRLALRLLLCQ